MGAYHVSPCAVEDEQNQVLTWLKEFNHSTNDKFMKALDGGAEEPFFLVAKNADGNVLGGVTGTVMLKWLKIYVTAVDPQCRGQGIGRELMLGAEAYGRGKGCAHIYVDTMSFQAPGFYQKLGYREVGRYADWDSHGHDKVFLAKDLEPRTPSPPIIKKAGFVAFPASDFEASLVFYRDRLGLPVCKKGADGFSRFVQFDVNGLGIRVYQWKGEFKRAHSGIQFYVDGVDELYAELKSQGVQFNGEVRDEPWGGRVVTVRDPDGNLFDLLDSRFEPSL